MLEDMEELFRIDSNAYCCGCLPDLTSGLLGLRVLEESQKFLNKIISKSTEGFDEQIFTIFIHYFTIVCH